MAARRLTRDEKRAQTRASLLEAASRIFAQQGFAGASLGEIAEAAGFSKGAIYSNFESKEELFLAVLDRHDRAQRDALTETLSEGHTLHERLASLGKWFRLVMETEQDWTLLTLEFAMFAARNPRLQHELAQRHVEQRKAIAHIISEQASDLRLELPAPPDLLADAVLATGTGISVQRLLDREAADDRLFTTAVALLLGQRPE